MDKTAPLTPNPTLSPEYRGEGRDGLARLARQALQLVQSDFCRYCAAVQERIDNAERCRSPDNHPASGASAGRAGRTPFACRARAGAGRGRRQRSRHAASRQGADGWLRRSRRRPSRRACRPRRDRGDHRRPHAPVQRRPRPGRPHHDRRPDPSRRRCRCGRRTQPHARRRSGAD